MSKNKYFLKENNKLKPIIQALALACIIFFTALILPCKIFAQGRAPVISYQSPNTYPLGTTIAPLTPTNTGGAVAAPGYNSTATFVSFGPGSMFFVAVDKAGNAFCTNLNGTAVTEFPAGEQDSYITYATGFNGPTGLVIDGAGNMYVADAGNHCVKKIPAGATTPVIVASGFNSPAGLAVDGNGNVYMADAGVGIVYEIPASGATPIPLANGLGPIEGIAIDGSGDIYVTNPNNTWVTELPSGDYSVQAVLGSGFKNPYGVAVDASGNVFVMDNGNQELKEIPANGDAIINMSSLGNPYAVTLSPSGSLYVTSMSGLELSAINPAGGYYLNTILSNGLSFDPTTGIISGQPQAESPATNYTVTGYNAYGSGSAVVNIKTVSTNTGVTIQFSKGTSSPAYPPYTLLVTNGTTSVTATAILADTTATVTLNGMAERSGKASGPIALSVGSNYVTVVVTAEDGTTKQTHTFNIIRPSTNAKLTSLTISSGTLTPGFNSNTVTYTDAVSYLTTSVTVTPTVAVTGATVTINGTAVTSGSPSAAIALSVGANTITTVVTAQDGSTTNTYTITVNRPAASSNANLSNLTVSKGTLNPSFTAGQLSYTDMVTNGTTSVTITPTLADPTATVTVNGATVTSGKASGPIALSVGSNTVFIYVTAQDGSDTQSYDVTVIRPSTNAKLSSLKISSGTLTPAFNTNTTSYTDAVTNETASITVTPTVAETDATVTVNGIAVASGSPSEPIALTAGSNTITTVVTAQDGMTADTYTVTVNRATPSTNANLSNLTASKGTLSPTFAAATLGYTDMVTNGTASVTLTPTLADPTATVSVNGAAVTSGKASGPIALTVGSNTINVFVTAQDGATTQTYTVNVIRPSTNAKLTSLTISSGTLTPAFNSNTTTYTDAVTNATASVSVTPTVAVMGATVTVNGITVISGSPSGAIALSVGANTITTVVTAQDGVTTDTYTITVTRAASGENIPDEAVSVSGVVQNFEPLMADDGINVHPGVSPNGDGIDDYLQIDDISRYPDNKLSIMNRNGILVFEAKSYDNSTKVFDGHSNKNGQMQQSGTYFYELDYTVNGVIKHKTGFLVLKY